MSLPWAFNNQRRSYQLGMSASLLHRLKAPSIGQTDLQHSFTARSLYADSAEFVAAGFGDGASQIRHLRRLQKNRYRVALAARAELSWWLTDLPWYMRSLKFIAECVEATLGSTPAQHTSIHSPITSTPPRHQSAL